MARKKKNEDENPEKDGWEKLPDNELKNWKESGEIPDAIKDRIKKANNKKKKPTKKKDDSEIDKKIRNRVLKEEKEKLSKTAEKLALQLATQNKLQTQIELTDEQKEAALLIASGYSYKEASDRVGISLVKVEEWLKIPEFSRQLNEYTVKEGVSDKNDRIRKQKRIVEEMYATLLNKIANNKLDELPLTALNDMLLKHAQRLDSLLEVKEDNKNRDITVLILSHVKQQGSDYNSLEEMIKADSESYNIIDVEAEEINDEG